MLKKLILSIAFLIIVLLGIVALQPSEFRIERSLSIQASKEEAFDLVNNFHHWQEWSPWAHLDPQMKINYDGPASGKGASMHWSGNKEAGEGKMTITESQSPAFIRIQLEFLRPYPASNTSEFIFETNRGQTLVTWAMSGKNSFVGKAFALLMNMDKLVGKDFENGLGQIKLLAERKKAG